MVIERHKRELIFLIKFFLIYGILQAIIQIAPMDFVTEPIASFEASLLGLKSEQNSIIAGPATFVINNSCTGFVSVSVLAAIVFSFRRPELRRKLAVFVPCAVTLFFINLLRVYIVLFFGITVSYELAEPVHVASWFFMSGAIIALWYEATRRFAGIKDLGQLL
jgi:exosortase/archaeosortase family protein